MKRLLKFPLRVVALALALILAATLFPYAQQWLSELLPQGKYERFSKQLTHKMEKAGELTAVRYSDTGMMEAQTNALLIGSVQRVKVPYAYEIGLGLSLADVRLTATDTELVAAIPEARMLYDSFQVTGEPEVNDFWYRLTETRYQEMINEQAAACRSAYLENQQYLEEAWSAACEAIGALLVQWAGEQLPLTFVKLSPLSN